MLSRSICRVCHRPTSVCFCHLVEPIATPIQFVILRHPDESRRPIATAHMARLGVRGLKLFTGLHFSECEEVQDLLADPQASCYLLGAASGATVLGDDMTLAELRQDRERLVLFLLDGTWREANKLLRANLFLQKLPALRFDPTHLSRFRVRKQPQSWCFSTVEAVHFVIDRLAPLPQRRHDSLLSPLDYLVHTQETFAITRRNENTFDQFGPAARSRMGGQEGPDRYI